MDIYIASSFRNVQAVQLLRDRLREHAHNILDWTEKAPPLPPGLTLEERRAALDADERREIFDFCDWACSNADLVIYLGPSGQDAGCEIGMAYAYGAPVIAMYSPLEAPGTMLAGCVDYVCMNFEELLEAIDTVAETFLPTQVFKSLTA